MLQFLCFVARILRIAVGRGRECRGRPPEALVIVVFVWKSSGNFCILKSGKIDATRNEVFEFVESDSLENI